MAKLPIQDAVQINHLLFVLFFSDRGRKLAVLAVVVLGDLCPCKKLMQDTMYRCSVRKI